MKEIHTASDEQPRILDEEHRLDLDPGARFTLGHFSKEVCILLAKVSFLFLVCKVLLMLVMTV